MGLADQKQRRAMSNALRDRVEPVRVGRVRLRVPVAGRGAPRRRQARRLLQRGDVVHEERRTGLSRRSRLRSHGDAIVEKQVVETEIKQLPAARLRLQHHCQG